MAFSDIAKEMDDRFTPAFNNIAADIMQEFPLIETRVYSTYDVNLAVYKSKFLILNCTSLKTNQDNLQITIIIGLTQSTAAAPVLIQADASWVTNYSDQIELMIFPDKMRADGASLTAIQEGLPKLREALKGAIRKHI